MLYYGILKVKDLIYKMIFRIFWIKLTWIYIFRLKVHIKKKKYNSKELTVKILETSTGKDRMETERLRKTVVIN